MGEQKQERALMGTNLSYCQGAGSWPPCMSSLLVPSTCQQPEEADV